MVPEYRGTWAEKGAWAWVSREGALSASKGLDGTVQGSILR